MATQATFLKIRKTTGGIWEHEDDFGKFIISKMYCTADGEIFKPKEQGGSRRREYARSIIKVYDDNDGTADLTFATPRALMEWLKARQYVGFYQPGEVVIADIISSDLGNALIIGSDGLLYIAAGGGGGGVQSVTGTGVDNTDPLNPVITITPFDPSSHDLSEFNNASGDPFAHMSDITSDLKPLAKTVLFEGTPTTAKFADAVNSLPQFAVDQQVVLFCALQAEDGLIVNFDSYVFVATGLGYGTYGTGGDNTVTSSNIFLIAINKADVTTIENLANTQTIILGEIGTTPIETALNGFTETEINTTPPQVVIVKTLNSGVAFDYIFTGASGSYGVGGSLTAVAEDFELIPNAIEGLGSQNLLSVLQNDPGFTLGANVLSADGQAQWVIDMNGTQTVPQFNLAFGGNIFFAGHDDLSMQFPNGRIGNDENGYPQMSYTADKWFGYHFGEDVITVHSYLDGGDEGVDYFFRPSGLEILSAPYLDGSTMIAPDIRLGSEGLIFSSLPSDSEGIVSSIDHTPNWISQPIEFRRLHYPQWGAVIDAIDDAVAGAGAVDSVNGQTGVVVLNQDNIADGTVNKGFTATEKTKLAGIATGATANDTDANLKNRANHTGTQTASTISDLEPAVRATPLTGLSTATATAVTATDNILQGAGKLQAQINSNTSAIALKADDNLVAKLAGIQSFTGEKSFLTHTNIGANQTIRNASSSTYFTLNVGSNTTTPSITRNVNGSTATFNFVNADQNSTGDLTDWSSNIGGTTAIRAKVTKDGTFVGTNVDATNKSDIAGKAPILSQSSLTYAATITLDFNQTDVVRTLALTGDITFADPLNKAAAKEKVIIITADATSRNLAFPAWKWIGGVAPTTLAAGKTGVLSLYCKGTALTDVLASFSVEL